MAHPDLQPLTPELVDSAVALQPPGWGSIRDALELYVSAPFCRPVCLVEEGQVKALGNLSVFQGTGWISHLIVSPDLRGRGLGREIMERLLKTARDEGVETLSLIATAEGEPLYRKLGFRDFARYAVMASPGTAGTEPSKPEQSEAVPSGEHLPAGVRRFVPEDIPRLSSLDLAFSGERRARLLTRYLDNVLVFGEDGEAEGFYLPDLREGPVLAGTPQAGSALMGLRARMGGQIKLPEGNSSGLACLEGLGWKFERWSRRMILGPDLAWDPSLLWARIGGNFG